MLDIRSFVLSPAMRDALFDLSSNKKDAWHFFSGLRFCPNCKIGVQTPYEFPEDKIPSHQPCEKAVITTSEDKIRLDGMPSLDPVGTDKVAEVLEDIRHGMSAEKARPLIKTLLQEMIPK